MAASTQILMLLMALSCTYCAPTPFNSILYTRPDSCFGGLKRGEHVFAQNKQNYFVTGSQCHSVTTATLNRLGLLGEPFKLTNSSHLLQLSYLNYPDYPYICLAALAALYLSPQSTKSCPWCEPWQGVEAPPA